MRIVFIETDRITNEIIRAVAGAAPNCVGYPDGVPESWRDVSGAQQVPENAGKHFICETRAFPDCELDPAALLGPVVEPVDWRPVTYADLPPGDMVQLGNDLFRAYLASRADDEPADWPDERGDDEC